MVDYRTPEQSSVKVKQDKGGGGGGQRPVLSGAQAFF